MKKEKKARRIVEKIKKIFRKMPLMIMVIAGLIIGMAILDETTNIFKRTYSGFDNEVSYTSQEASKEGLEWEFISVENDLIEIIGYTGSNNNVIIPDYIDGNPVIRIAYHAFENNSSITIVRLPKNIHYIDSYSFANCQNLQSINIPSSVDIWPYAFEGCVSLKHISFEENEKNINEFEGTAYYEREKLKTNILAISVIIFFLLSCIFIITAIVKYIEGGLEENPDLVMLNPITLIPFILNGASVYLLEIWDKEETEYAILFSFIIVFVIVLIINIVKYRLFGIVVSLARTLVGVVIGAFSPYIIGFAIVKYIYDCICDSDYEIEKPLTRHDLSNGATVYRDFGLREGYYDPYNHEEYTRVIPGVYANRENSTSTYHTTLELGNEGND